MILGMPWLCKWNPRIDWLANTVSIPRSLASPPPDYLPQRDLLCWLGLDADRKISRRLDKRQAWLNREQINKTTISTQIAQATPSVDPIVPKWCKDFADVFSEKTHDQLPPHHPYDHTIDLCPDFTPKIAKVYSLNPTEMETCKSFVEEHLKTGWIVPSKSPQASPFFFIPKKDGTLRPCQDYRYLNSHTIQNAYPLPLIPELIDNMKESTLFTKSTFVGDITTFASEKKINGRLLSSPPWDFLNPLSCSLGSATLPPPSKLS